MDQVHNLHLQSVQEIGFIREVDQALSKSLMVEFLRIQAIIVDDLSGIFWAWQTDMEATTDTFLRDLEMHCSSNIKWWSQLTQELPLATWTHGSASPLQVSHGGPVEFFGHGRPTWRPPQIHS